MQETTRSNARDVTSEESELERLAREVAELREENAANRAALAAIQVQVAGRPASLEPDAALGQRGPSSKRRLARRRRPSGPDDGRSSGLVSRRRLFGLLGGAAAAGAGLAVIGSAGDPAGAVNPSFILDQTNTGTATTDLTGSVSGDSILTVENTNTDPASNGVFVTTTHGNAIVGQANGSADGVFGASSTGFAGAFQSSATGISTGTQLWLSPGSAVGHPTGGEHDAGELWLDSNAVLWLCVAIGTPGTWVNLSTGSNFVPLAAPIRCYDSRPGDQPTDVTKGPLSNGQSRTVDLTHNSTGIPTTAAAVLTNLTIVNTVGEGFLAMFSAGVTWPGNSSINWFGANQILANNATSAFQVSGQAANVAVLCGGVGTTDFLVDVLGYFV